MAREKRKYPRTAVGTEISYRPVPTEVEAIDYLKGVVENVSLGGIFITTDDPLPKDSLVELEFRIPLDSDVRTVRATALVKWMRQSFHPKGMGLEFVDFFGLGRIKLETWLERILESQQD